MRINRNQFLSGLATMVLALGVCFRFFKELLLHPNEYLFGADGDGLKNYYSVAYQVVHGDGMWFSGMLYPFGDHLTFADGQPLLTQVLSWFVEPSVSSGHEIIGIMNLLMLLSLVIAAWCVHRILVWNHVGPWFAVPFALCIAFLSPQVARFTGHYALGYTFFVPASWLLISAFQRFGKPWLIALLASLFVLSFAFIHPYYLFIFIIFLGAVLFWETILARFNVKTVRASAPQLLTLVVPLVVFFIYQKMADPYSDRPSNPYGMFSHMASFQSVFTPTAEPFRSLFHSYFFRLFIPTSWEGHAYIGMIAVFAVFSSLLPAIKKLKTRGVKLITHPVLPASLKQVFIPGIITLLFAFGLFHSLGLAWLADYFLPIKQFRSLGRVAWIFYYVISVWTVFKLYGLYRLSKQSQHGRFAYPAAVVLVTALFFWTLDSVVNIKFMKEQVLNQSATIAFSDTYAEEWRNAGVILKDHEAILPLPMTLIGSEKIGLESGKQALKHAMIGSFSTGLPIVGGAMSRTSLKNTEMTAQLVADPLFPRDILHEMEDGLKLLLVSTSEPKNVEEQRLIALSEKVFENSEYQLHSVAVEELKLMYAEIAASCNEKADTGNVVYLKPSNYELEERNIWGAPTYKVEAGTNLLDSTFQHNQQLNLSYWVRVDPNEELLPNMAFIIDGQQVSGGMIGSSPDLLDGWLLVSEDLNIEADKHHQFRVTTRAGTIGRVMLRTTTDTIINTEESGTRFLNNVPIP